MGPLSLPSPDGLIALDLLCWLGSGRDVAERMNCNASTVSRKAEGCAVSLGLLLRKRAGLWTLYGDAHLLQAERDLHQRYRLAGYGPLRLDLSADVSHLVASPPSDVWVGGGQCHFNSRRPLELLEQRVTDAWLCSFCEELPNDADNSCLVLELARLPLHLIAHKNHRLLARTGWDGLEIDDLRSCPCLALPDHCQPRRQAVLRHLGLANQMLSLERHDPGKWDDPLDDEQTIRTGTLLDLSQHIHWRALSVPLDHEVRIGLVIRRDLHDQEAVQTLHETLLARVRQQVSEAAAR